MLTNYSHWALSVPELAKKVHASRANLEFFFFRVYRIRSGYFPPPAVDECLPVNYAKKIWTHAKHAIFCYISRMEMKFS